MNFEILPPTDDWIFKLLFGDERNKSILIDLLKSFVELPEEEYELTFTIPATAYTLKTCLRKCIRWNCRRFPR